MFHIGKVNELSRRAFMQRSSQLAVMGAASGYAMGLSGLSDALAFDSSGGYKALVCVFLLGGNDHANTLIPYDTANYNLYKKLRGSVVSVDREPLARQVLKPRGSQKLTDDMQLALAPTMPRLKARFDEGVMAPLLNVGPLIVPLTLQQYRSGNRGTYPLPPKLFSHNDQQSTWQSGAPEGASIGWGGRIADIAASSNTNSMFTAISGAGNQVFLSGKNARPYNVSSTGVVKMNALEKGHVYGSAATCEAMKDLLTNATGHVFESDYATANTRSIKFSEFVSKGLSKINVKTDFGNDNTLAKKLRTVARLIAARDLLGVKRQVFMVVLGGFDSHAGLNNAHPYLLGQVDFALNAFYSAMKEMGVANNVTTFTASDFGRTLSANGNGSDHGWGGHHFIMGGGVRGGQFYGTAPHISTNGNDQVNRGRLLPSTSVDEYSATLAKWFGISNTEMNSVLPNIKNFNNPDLGFMR